MMQILIFELPASSASQVRTYLQQCCPPTLCWTVLLSYNLCHQDILNGLEKFMQRHAAAQFCCVSIKKSLLGGEIACTTVCRMTLSQTRDELCTPDQSTCRREYCGSQAATSKLRCRVPYPILIVYLCNWQLGQDVNVLLETRSSGRYPSGCQA